MSRALDRFDDESVNRKPQGGRTNSASALIIHACAAAIYWFEHVGLGRPTERDRDAEFAATANVAELRDLLTFTADRLTVLTSEFDAGPTATDHEQRVFLYEGDYSDASVALHALEELFQHLGHLEVTADALTPST
jgi:Protein of unknown function (DUF664)